MDALCALGSLAIGYACGSFLTADVVSRRRCGKSAFDIGVGNPGMANVGHELGKGAAVEVLAGDILKTVASFALARAAFPAAADAAGTFAVLGATLGHNYPAWHHFKGGKGVATTCAGIILASPLLGSIASVAGFATVLATGYLCRGAMAIPICYTALEALFGSWGKALFGLVLSALMYLAHGDAIRGIATGQTPRAAIAERFRKRG
jgi:glycerol-3-phosphate acyltransferase PlsY